MIECPKCGYLISQEEIRKNNIRKITQAMYLGKNRFESIVNHTALSRGTVNNILKKQMKKRNIIKKLNRRANIVYELAKRVKNEEKE